MREHNLPAEHENLEGHRRIWERELHFDGNVPKDTPPCPSWCTRPAGHEYDSIDGFGDETEFQRQHTTFEGEYITVDATEHNLSGVVQVDEPSAYLYGEKGELTSAQIRAVAAELVTAAEVLERVTGSALPRPAAHRGDAGSRHGRHAG